MNHRNYKYIFTVFTPTFNRAHTLNRVYDSLKNQTFKNFEWLIIDDGSTDNTEGIVSDWQKETLFSIRYFKQANRGKHFAVETAVEQAQGELFLTLDSDDACVPQALERFYFHWQNIPEMERVNFSAVTTLCMNEEGEPISSQKFPFNPTDSNSLEIKHRYKFDTEAWGFQKTDIMREFSFKTNIERSYVPEGIIWTQIARKYKTRFVNEYLRIYYRGHASIMTSSFKKRAEGVSFWYIFALNNNLDYFNNDPVAFISNAINLCRYSLHNNRNVLSIVSELKPLFAKVLYLMTIPLGVFFYYKDILTNK